MEQLIKDHAKRRVIIVSNRLPVSVAQKKDGLEIKPSAGGLATGLASFHRQSNGVWIGWPGFLPPSNNGKESLQKKLREEFQCLPVYLTALEVKRYYDGFSNNTLWPLFHYFPARCAYEPLDWEFYQKVNQKFFEQVKEVIQPDDLVWVQDYHLLLLPQLIREAFPEATVGIFLHIPFPSMEVFRYLPWRKEILQGMLGADLIGFHTYDYSRHFLSSVLRLLGKEHNYGQIVIGNRIITVNTFPMGINAQNFVQTANSEAVKVEVAQLKNSLKTEKMILSVDRLDFTKGIPERIKAYQKFLEQYPDWHGKITYVMLCVPSRNKIPQYQQLKREVDELVGRVNGRFNSPQWTPILYMYRSVPFETLVSLYSYADLALVCPLRDGMNLVAKEYIACQSQAQKGMLVLSETAGAAAELGEAIIVNPNDIQGIAAAIAEGLAMSQQEKVNSTQLMAKRIEDYNVFRWSEDFIEQLLNAKENQEQKRKYLLRGESLDLLRQDYEQARHRLLLLDYDGTLVSFAKRPELASPDAELLALMEDLAKNSWNKVVVISGRNREFLEKWLGDTGVDLVAEHGAWIKAAGEDSWESQTQGISTAWKETILPIMENFTERTPGSLIEEKSFALVWHFRKVEPELGLLKSRELLSALRNHLTGSQLHVLLGNKVVEVKQTDIHKGKGALYYLEKDPPWDFIMGMGDDYTDEDIFAVLPESAWGIKIGYEPFTKARYYLESSVNARELLRRLADAKQTEEGRRKVEGESVFA
jgi:trehalose 6-phosphate synthase/phosphatase